MSNTTQHIIPMLAYENGVAAMDWLCRVFGFTEKTRWLDDNGRLSHGEIALGNNVIMLASPTQEYQSPKHHRQICEAAAKWYQAPYIMNGVLIYVDDVQAHYQKAKEAGAVILTGLEAGGPGLLYRVEDLEGQRWMFMQKDKHESNLNRIHHIAIICSDYERSKKFYTSILGFEIIKETYRELRQSYKLDLSLNGDYVIELFSFPNPPARPSRPEATGLRHLAFEVDHLDSIVEKLTRNGIEVEPIRIDELTNKRFTFIADPDDLPIEFYEK